MAWNVVRNDEPEFWNAKSSGVCKQTGEKAEVTSFFSGKKECKVSFVNSSKVIVMSR